MSKEYVERVLRARVYDVARETPLEPAPRLSRRIGNNVLLKREDLQPVFSFKLRGAYNKMSSLTEEERARGVVASSAGNHAQGVAMSAQRLGMRAVIVMPVTTPTIKVDAVRDLGAEIELYGTAYDDAKARAEELSAEQGLVIIPPFDDPDVIAGQGTIGMEILRQHGPAIDAIFIAIGGGGLAAGVGAYVKALWPNIRIIGVEPVDAASMRAAIAAGGPTALDSVGLFADGVAVRKVGTETYRIVSQVVDEIITVNTDEMCAAIKDIYEDTRAIVEPAGALGVAGVKKMAARDGLQGQTLVAINCGANVNFDRLRHIAERAALGEQREALLAVTIPERPGAYRDLCERIGARAVTEFNYRYAGEGSAQVFLGLGLEGGEAERHAAVERLRAAEYPVVDLTDNEMAKLHVRYMVGGRAPAAPAARSSELLYRFNFPEKPGALMRFLEEMGYHGHDKWNISLFHYRNEGADLGRVLVGIQVPDEDLGAFDGFLDALGYENRNESDNPAFKIFLA